MKDVQSIIWRLWAFMLRNLLWLFFSLEWDHFAAPKRITDFAALAIASIRGHTRGILLRDLSITAFLGCVLLLELEIFSFQGVRMYNISSNIFRKNICHRFAGTFSQFIDDVEMLAMENIKILTM